MADENLTDEQQAELVKKWWRENGVYILAGLVLGVGGLFGWQAWQSSEMVTSEEASMAYQEMALAVSQKRYNKATEVRDLINEEYSSTPYADTSDLALAASLMEQNQPEQAVEVLQRLVTGANEASSRTLAQLRLGRVYLHLGDLDAATAQAIYSAQDAYAPLFADLRGDIAYASGELEVARREYEAALEMAGPGFPQAGYVRVKLDSIAPAMAEVAAE